MQLDTFSNLVSSSSQTGKIYGLAKVHKESTTPRPVVSMIRTAEYNLAKYIVKIMNFATTCMLNLTGSFVSQISSFDFQSSHVMVSYDVVSLFTNIPLSETIDIVCNYAYQQHNNNITTMKNDNEKSKCVIFKCYSSEELITLNTLHEDVSSLYSFHS